MKFKIGDFVRFVDEEGEGRITSILEDGLIGVTDSDGFEIPVLATKVTTIHEYKNDIKTSSVVENEPLIREEEFIEEGLSLVIIGEQRQGIVEFILVNETSYQLLYSFNTEKSKQLRGEKAGEIAPHSSTKIYTANSARISDWPLFNFQFIYHTSLLRDAVKPLVLDKKIRPADLSTSKKHVPLLNEKGWVFKLDEIKAGVNTDQLKEHFISHRPSKKN